MADDIGFSKKYTTEDFFKDKVLIGKMAEKNQWGLLSSFAHDLWMMLVTRPEHRKFLEGVMFISDIEKRKTTEMTFVRLWWNRFTQQF